MAENFGEIPRESQLVSESPRQFVMSQTVTDSPSKELMAGKNSWQFYFTQGINALMLVVISTIKTCVQAQLHTNAQAQRE